MSAITLKSVLNELEQIKTENKQETCGICSLELLSTDKVKLKCKHEYHHDCILNWYIKTISNNSNVPSTLKSKECPYCRQIGGYLPIRPNDTYIKHIHSPKYGKIDNKSLAEILKPRVKCAADTKSGKKCKMYSKNGDYCHLHKKN